MGLSSSKSAKAKPAQILLLGLDAAGKSTVLYKLKLAGAVVTAPTVGFNVEMLELGKGLWVTVWDVGGQERMRAAWDCYCERADALVFVVDSADARRLRDARRELERLLRSERLGRVPLVLLANKQDRPGALAAEDLTRLLRVRALCADRRWCVQPCCALTGDGLGPAFRRLAEFLRGRRGARADTFAFLQQD